MPDAYPIGVFDSGYGGLTVLRAITRLLPEYDFIYLGDNARAPYGNRSFETVYHYTKESVEWFFEQGCPLVILACNTSSAKALRSIQQKDLPLLKTNKRVLGVIRPTTEMAGNLTKTGNIGVLATRGTVLSGSYKIEINKFFPQVKVYQQACPLWVPLIENDEQLKPGADYFVKKYIDALLSQCSDIDTILLACTHYPLIMDKLKMYVPANIQLLSQGEIVAKSLKSYLSRHPEIDNLCSRTGNVAFYTTDSPEDFDQHAAIFYDGPVKSEQVWQ